MRAWSWRREPSRFVCIPCACVAESRQAIVMHGTPPGAWLSCHVLTPGVICWIEEAKISGVTRSLPTSTSIVSAYQRNHTRHPHETARRRKLANSHPIIPSPSSSIPGHPSPAPHTPPDPPHSLFPVIFFFPCSRADNPRARFFFFLSPSHLALPASCSCPWF